MPTSAHRGNKATGTLPCGFRGDFRPYSCAMPGTTNASVVGFMTSMVTATAMTARSARWARWIGVSSNAATRTPATRSG